MLMQFSCNNIGMTRPTSIANVNTVGQDVLGKCHKKGEILCQELQRSSRHGPVTGPPNKVSSCFQIRKDFGDVGKTERSGVIGRE